VPLFLGSFLAHVKNKHINVEQLCLRATGIAHWRKHAIDANHTATRFHAVRAIPEEPDATGIVPVMDDVLENERIGNRHLLEHVATDELKSVNHILILALEMFPRDRYDIGQIGNHTA
jgi:hypothetical protein